MLCNQHSLHIVFLRQKLTLMTPNLSQSSPRPSMLRAVLTDVQFWIPLAVLAGGLIVLRWIS